MISSDAFFSKSILWAVFLISGVMQSAVFGRTVSEDTQGLQISPSISMSVIRDNNVFSRVEKPVDDRSIVIHPSISIVNNLDDDQYSLVAGLKTERYSTLNTQDNDEYEFALFSRKALGRDHRLELFMQTDRTTEKQFSAENFQGELPGKIDEMEVSARYAYQAGRIPFGMSLTQNRYRYQQSSADQVSRDDDPRDRNETVGSLRVGYMPVPGSEVFIELQTGNIESTADSLSEEASRDASISDFLIGYANGVGDLIRVNATIGRYSRSFDAELLGDVSGMRHEANVSWQVTPLTSLHFKSGKRFELTRLVASPGYESLRNTLKLRHKFRRYLLAEVQFFGGSDSYLKIPTEDTVTGYGMSLKYRAGRYLSFYISLEQESRERLRESEGEFKEETVEKSLFELGTELIM
jgi:hypothetical protein